MIIKVPSQIRIGAYEYCIKYREGLVKHAGSTGQCYTSDATIWIDPDELKQVKDVTFFHEVIHCISDVERLGLEESDIDRIAHCLVRILRENLDVEFDWEDIE